MQILSIKRSIPSNDRLGYLRAILVKENDTWTVASKTNVPDSGEAFVFSNYKSVNSKFKINELILAELSELGDTDGSCIYGTSGEGTKNVSPDDDIVLIFRTDEKLENQDFYKVESAVRPPVFSFLETEREGDHVIVGPMSLISTNFNETTQRYESKLGLVGDKQRIFNDLKAYSAYVIPLTSLPENTFLEAKPNFNSFIKIGVGILSFIKASPIDQIALITDSSLIRLLDESLNSSSKLGRKGKREAIVQLEASKKLSPAMKPLMLDLLGRMEDLDEQNKKLLTDVVSQFSSKDSKVFLEGAGDTVVQKSEISDLKKQLSDSETAKKRVSGDLKNLSVLYEKLEAKEDSDRISDFEEENKDLKEKLEVLKNSEMALIDITDLKNQGLRLKDNIEELAETKDGLNDTVSSLKSDLALSLNQFRTKALSVLPFFEIMNNVRTDDNLQVRAKKIDPEQLFEPKNLAELIEELASRVLAQGYQADADWLKLVSALYLSNQFIGFFGDPGTGKTTLAQCFQGAFGAKELSSELVKVGRGWTSFSDFVGYDNSFTSEFKYKSKYFKQFETDAEKNHVFQSLIFDEATLSSPEFYLSNFSSDTVLSRTCDDKQINLDGHILYFQADTRFILVFNVDETTEQLSDRFISRMPVVRLTSNKDFNASEEIQLQDFPAINKATADRFLKEALEQNENSEKYTEEYENRFATYWKKLLSKDLEQRKVKQIENFISISSTITVIDPSIIIDFVEEVFLLPLVKGDGVQYLEALEETIPLVRSSNAKRRLGNILSEGRKYNIFRHI